ncbi:MAG: endo-1,4-beta-xylanase [Puniceicoccaceae bacterium]
MDSLTFPGSVFKSLRYRVFLPAWATAFSCLAIPLLALASPAPNSTFWEEAELRIEKHRKNDLIITVVDPHGRPVEGIPVSVRMLRHGFRFGTAVNERRFWDLDPDSPFHSEGGTPSPEENDFYRDRIETLFNQITLENGLKWHKWEDPIRQPKSLGLLEWAAERQIEARGHAMVWGRKGWDTVPPDVAGNRTDPDYVANRIFEHIKTIGQHPLTKGILIDWDVLNEPLNERALTDLFSPGLAPQDSPVLKPWFEHARSADPNAKLYINEFEILMGHNAKLRDAYFKMIQNLIDQGASIDGIGMQSHFWRKPPPITEIKERLDRFAQLGLPIQITEFDMYEWGDEVEKAAFMHDFLKLVFSVPEVEAFTMWGFWDASHWKKSAPLYFSDQSLKPSGQVYLDLVFDQWWTNAQGHTQADGTFTTRAFHGQYEIKIVVNGREFEKRVKLLDDPEPGRFHFVADSEFLATVEN